MGTSREQTSSKIDRFKIDGPKIDGPKIDGPKIDGPKINEFKINEFKINGFQMKRFKIEGFNIQRFKMKNFKIMRPTGTTSLTDSHRSDKNPCSLSASIPEFQRLNVSGIPDVPMPATPSFPQHRRGSRVASFNPTAMHLLPNPQPGAFLHRFIQRYPSLARRIGRKVISAVPYALEASISSVPRGLTLAFRSPRSSGPAQALPPRRGAAEKVRAKHRLFVVAPLSSEASVSIPRRTMLAKAPFQAPGDEFFHTAEGTSNANRDAPGICYLAGNHLR